MINQHKTIREEIERYNKSQPIVDYLRPFIPEEGKIKIADIGAGPFCKIGNFIEGKIIQVLPSDNQDFSSFYRKYNVIPAMVHDYQDMENLTYSDNYFDLVHCANALDHTKNAYRAVLEMIRVCKPGGWVYIECNLDQMDTGHKHYWNAKADGVFTNKVDSFDLKHLGFEIEYINNGGATRYDKIIAKLKK